MSGRMRLLAGRLRRLERVRIGDPELIIVKCHESISEERVGRMSARGHRARLFTASDSAPDHVWG